MKLAIDFVTYLSIVKKKSSFVLLPAVLNLSRNRYRAEEQNTRNLEREQRQTLGGEESFDSTSSSVSSSQSFSIVHTSTVYLYDGENIVIIFSF